MEKGLLMLTFIFIVSVCFPVHVMAQSNCGMSAIENAEKEYALGKFEKTLNILNTCLDNNGFEGSQKEDAYRIKAFTLLAIDSVADARLAVLALLDLNPSYNSRSDDPLPFRNMVYDIRLGNFDVQITSVSKKPENIKEAPATVLVITEEEIAQRGYIDLESMLSDLPGFDISRMMGINYSNVYQRGYRSNSTDRTLFLIDGVEENSLWSNTAPISRQYPISNIKRVEVIYGPASTMYGANAFVGVINVITKNPDELLDGKKYHLSGEVSMGNYNTKYGELTFATRKNNISFSATGRVFSSDEIDLSGFEEFDYNLADYDTINYASILGVSNPDSSFIGSPYYAVEGDTAILTPAGAEAARNFDKQGIATGGLNNGPIEYSNKSDHYFLSTKLAVNHFSLVYQYWQSYNGTLTYSTDNREAGAAYGGIWSPSQSFINATYSRELNDKLTITNISQYRINRVAENTRAVKVNNYSNGRLTAANLLSDDAPFWESTYFYQQSRQFRNELKVNYQPFRGLDIVSGLEIRNSAIQGNYRNLTLDGISPEVDSLSVVEFGTSSLDTVPGGNMFSVYDYGYYIQGSYDINSNLNLTLGGRIDYNKVRATGGYGTVFNPRIAVVYTPGKMIMKAVYARAFKDATNFQKYATTSDRLFNNPNLLPENVNNYEVSVGYKLNKRLFVDASAYYSTYSGAIAAKKVIVDGVSSARNEAVGELRIYGIQASVKYKVGNYAVYGNYSFVEPKIEELDTLGLGTGNFIRVGDIASHRINFGANALYFDRLNINLRANFASRRFVGEGTSVASNTLGDFPSFFLLNGAVTYKNLVPGLNLQLSVNNILNQDYSDPGIRSADGITRPYRVPQRGIFAMFKLIYSI